MGWHGAILRERKPGAARRRKLSNANRKCWLIEFLLRKEPIMKLLFIATTLAFAITAGNACAADATEKDAIALVEKGVAFMKVEGKDEMMKRINNKDPAFFHGALYLHMRDAKNAVMLAHPVNPTLIGKDLIDVPDTNGKVYRRDIVNLAASQGKGWVDYTYKNPVNGKIEPKNTYMVKVGDVLLEAGIYKK
jgi:cytochrome c